VSVVADSTRLEWKSRADKGGNGLSESNWEEVMGIEWVAIVFSVW
jgi:hypothetical protein